MKTLHRVSDFKPEITGGNTKFVWVENGKVLWANYPEMPKIDVPLKEYKP